MPLMMGLSENKVSALGGSFLHSKPRVVKVSGRNRFVNQVVWKGEVSTGDVRRGRGAAWLGVQSLGQPEEVVVDRNLFVMSEVLTAVLGQREIIGSFVPPKWLFTNLNTFLFLSP